MTIEWDTQARKMLPSHAAELGRILNMNQEWRWLMGHIPKDFFALDANDKEDKKFTTADIG